MPRTKTAKSKHDIQVKKDAQALIKMGFDVRADIPGFSKPKSIGGYIPDVEGIKGKKKVIIEVETPDSVDSARDIKQQKAFLAAAKRSKNTTYKRKITK